MNTEIRNELLILLSICKKNKIDEFNVSSLLERFETDIKNRLNDLEYEKEKLKNDYEVLQYVKEELNIK